jgi:hypothetical protein
MPEPSPSDLYISRPLTNISVAYQQNQQDYVAGDIFPEVPVQHQGDLYYIYRRDDWYRSIAGVRAPATESVGGGWDVTTDSYYADVYAVHKDLDDQTRANADTAFNLDRDATLYVTTNLLLKREQLFLGTYMTTGVWTGGYGADQTGVGSAPGSNQFLQFDVAGSTPIEVITKAALQMAKTTGFRPNFLIMGATVENVLMNHAEILERIKYTERGIVTRDLMAALFGIPKIVTPMAIENTAPKGGTASYGLISDKAILMGYAAPNPGLMTPTAGYIFTWTGLLPGGAYTTRIKRFRMEQIESDRIEGSQAWAMKVVSPELGQYFSAVVS